MANHIMYNFKCCLIVQLNIGLSLCAFPLHFYSVIKLLN
jgi:hypothetical protein